MSYSINCYCGPYFLCAVDKDALSGVEVAVDVCKERIAFCSSLCHVVQDHVFIPNICNTPREFSIDPTRDKSYMDLTEFNFRDEMRWLEENYANEFEKLKTVYGADKANVRWGVFCYWW